MTKTTATTPIHPVTDKVINREDQDNADHGFGDDVPTFTSTLRPTRIVGPVTRATYEAFATGGTWNGNPVMAFTAHEIRAFITAGDGADANGTGLQIRDDEVVDVDDSWSEGVPTFLANVRGEMRLLYAPQGRTWDEVN